MDAKKQIATDPPKDEVTVDGLRKVCDEEICVPKNVKQVMNVVSTPGWAKQDLNGKTVDSDECYD